jgi:hypothetical protein
LSGKEVREMYVPRAIIKAKPGTSIYLQARWSGMQVQGPNVSGEVCRI